MNWVEKSSIEKIRRLLEIAERERHYQVLLTPDNISVVRCNPAPYTLPIIPLPLPSQVVEGEHFVIADLKRLVSGSASSSRGSGNRGIESGEMGLKHIVVIRFFERGF